MALGKLREKTGWLRLLVLFVGLSIAHLGVTLFILASFGSDPFNVLVQGLSGTLSLSHGTVHIAVSLLLLVLILMIDRHYVKLGTIICMIFGGPIIDLFTLLLRGVINGQSPTGLRVLSMVAGCAILAFGMTLVIQSEAGTGANDLVSVIVSDKLKKPFGICRLCVDILFLAIGFFLGGTVGVGTVVCAVLVGPVAGKLLPISKKIVSKIVSPIQ